MSDTAVELFSTLQGNYLPSGRGRVWLPRCTLVLGTRQPQGRICPRHHGLFRRSPATDRALLISSGAKTTYVPSVCFEFLSQGTWRKNLTLTKDIYERRGVARIFHLRSRLQIRRSRICWVFGSTKGKYVEIVPEADGSMLSKIAQFPLAPGAAFSSIAPSEDRRICRRYRRRRDLAQRPRTNVRAAEEERRKAEEERRRAEGRNRNAELQTRNRPPPRPMLQSQETAANGPHSLMNRRSFIHRSPSRFRFCCNRRRNLLAPPPSKSSSCALRRAMATLFEVMLPVRLCRMVRPPPARHRSDR